MTSSIAYRVVFAISQLLSCVSCKKTGYVWQCQESTASKANQHNTCGCLLSDLLSDARDVPEEKLCSKKYECCVISTYIKQSETMLNKCECWNPSEGGATCHSKLPPPGQEDFMWKRVDRCAKW